MAANGSWIANVVLSNGDSGVCSVASERASSFSRAHSSGSCCCFCAAASAAAVVDRTCACSASCSGLTTRATALLQVSTLLPIGFSAIASIFSGDICCAKLALAAAKAGSSGCMLAKTASTLLICLCTLIASAGFRLNRTGKLVWSLTVCQSSEGASMLTWAGSVVSPDSPTLEIRLLHSTAEAFLPSTPVPCAAVAAAPLAPFSRAPGLPFLVGPRGLPRCHVISELSGNSCKT